MCDLHLFFSLFHCNCLWEPFKSITMHPVRRRHRSELHLCRAAAAHEADATPCTANTEKPRRTWIEEQFFDFPPQKRWLLPNSSRADNVDFGSGIWTSGGFCNFAALAKFPLFETFRGPSCVHLRPPPEGIKGPRVQRVCSRTALRWRTMPPLRHTLLSH